MLPAMGIALLSAALVLSTPAWSVLAGFTGIDSVSFDFAVNAVGYTGASQTVEATVSLAGTGLDGEGTVHIIKNATGEEVSAIALYAATNYTGTVMVELPAEPGAYAFTAKVHTTTGAEVSDSGTVNVFQLTVTADKSTIAAGHIDSPVHRAMLTAHITPSTLSGSVSFAVTAGGTGSTTARAAALSTTSPVTLGSGGDASVTLLSADKIGSVTVTATYEDFSEFAQSADVYCSGLTATWEFDPPSITVGESTTAKVRLYLGDTPVDGHHLTWEFAEVRSEDDTTVIYRLDPATGSLDGCGTITWTEASRVTDTNGLATATFASDTVPGWFYFNALDQDIRL